MTAPNGPILFNSSTGSDAAASGLGPAIAISGTGASLNATATVTLSTDTPDLSGVSAGDLLWVDTSSGRQFSIIASVDDGADTVTCDDAFGVTESARNWGIGGKRATFDNANSRTCFADCKRGWTIKTETDQTVSSSLTISGNLFALSGDELRTLNCTADEPTIILASLVDRIELLKITNSNGTKSSAYGMQISGGGEFGSFLRCVLGDATNQLSTAVNRVGGSNQVGFCLSEIHHCTGDGCNLGSLGGSVSLISCLVHSNGGHGIEGRTNTGNGTCVIRNSVLYSNTLSGFRQRKSASITSISGSMFWNNGEDGIDASSAGTVLPEIFGCVFTENGRYGINCDSDITYVGVQDFNAFGSSSVANTSGSVNNGGDGPNDITLTADPFVDAASGEFTLNDTAGGGAVLKAQTFAIGSTTMRPFRQWDDSSGSGSTLIVVDD